MNEIGDTARGIPNYWIKVAQRPLDFFLQEEQKEERPTFKPTVKLRVSTFTKDGRWERDGITDLPICDGDPKCISHCPRKALSLAAAEEISQKARKKIAKTPSILGK